MFPPPPPPPPFPPPPPPPPSDNTLQIVYTIGQAADKLLSQPSLAAYDVATATNRPTDNDLRAVQALTHRDLMQAVADGSRAIIATTALLRSQAGVRNLRSATMLNVTMAGAAAGAVCRYTHTVTQLLLIRLRGAGIGSGEGPPASSIPPDIRAVYEALAGSQLLAASAGAVLEDLSFGELPEGVIDSIYFAVNHAAAASCIAVFDTHRLCLKMAQAGCHEGQQLAAGLLRALRHREVQRLQVALLDRLAVHAGMGAGLVVEQGEQQQGKQGEQRACGWEGGSGTWWLAREEQRQGKLLGLDPNGGDACYGRDTETRWNTAGWLEDDHCRVLHGTLKEWAFVPAQLAAQAGVEARPPPLLVARLAARAAEALCRLCRGQGLGGAYAPAPTWELAKEQVGGRGDVACSG